MNTNSSKADKMKYQAKSGYVSRTIAGEMILLPVGENILDFNGLIHFNETAMFIWEQIKTPKSIDELCKLLCTEFDISDEDIEGDVKEFLKTAEKQGLIILKENT